MNTLKTKRTYGPDWEYPDYRISVAASSYKNIPGRYRAVLKITHLKLNQWDRYQHVTPKDVSFSKEQAKQWIRQNFLAGYIKEFIQKITSNKIKKSRTGKQSKNTEALKRRNNKKPRNNIETVKNKTRTVIDIDSHTGIITRTEVFTTILHPGSKEYTEVIVKMHAELEAKKAT